MILIQAARWSDLKTPGPELQKFGHLSLEVNNAVLLTPATLMQVMCRF